MNFLSKCDITYESLISRDWATSHESETDKLRAQTMALIQGEPQDKLLTKMQEVRNQYEKTQRLNQKKQLKAKKAEEFRSLLLGG